MEKDVIEKLRNFKSELQQVLDRANGDLRKVSQYTFEKRNADPSFPYMSINDLNPAKRGEVIGIAASPIKAQKELSEFFDIKADGSVLPKYKFYGDPTGIHFTMRLGNGKDNTIEL